MLLIFVDSSRRQKFLYGELFQDYGITIVSNNYHNTHSAIIHKQTYAQTLTHMHNIYTNAHIHTHTSAGLIVVMLPLFTDL